MVIPRSFTHPQMPFQSLEDYVTKPQMSERYVGESIGCRNISEIHQCPDILQQLVEMRLDLIEKNGRLVICKAIVSHTNAIMIM